MSLATAQVKSRAELDAYLANNPNSAFNAISPASRKAFIDSLVFTDLGLASYSTTALRGLRVSVVYQILGVFGFQHAVSGMSGLKVEDEIDQGILALRPVPTINYRQACKFVYTSSGGRYQCTSNPEANCEPGNCR